MSVSRAVEWGVLLGMRKVETVEQMPEEYRQVDLGLAVPPADRGRTVL